MVNNYLQALSIIRSEPELRKAMAARELVDADFPRWLEEERCYLANLKTEPIEETLQMDYYQKLVNLQDARYEAVNANGFNLTLQPGRSLRL